MSLAIANDIVIEPKGTKMRKLILGILAGAATLALLTGCTIPSRPATEPTPVSIEGVNPKDLPAPGQPNTQMGLTIRVTGSCQDFNGFRLESSGFTPNGLYHTEAWYPTGQKYESWKDIGYGPGIGQADANGATPRWTWNCKVGAGGRPDPNGVYVIKLTNVKDVTDPTKNNWVMAKLEVKL